MQICCFEVRQIFTFNFFLNLEPLVPQIVPPKPYGNGDMPQYRVYQAVMPDHGVEPLPQADPDILLGMAAVEEGAEYQMRVHDGLMC